MANFSELDVMKTGKLDQTTVDEWLRSLVFSLFPFYFFCISPGQKAALYKGFLLLSEPGL